MAGRTRRRPRAALRSGALNDVTDLLHAWRDGDQGALATLMPLVQEELRRLARRRMRGERAGHTLQPTALVNEAYLRMVDLQRMDWKDRRHFFAMAARVMRRVLVDLARARASDKRGAAPHRITLDDGMVATAADHVVDILAVDQALERLAAIDERKARVVELRFFAGMSVEEAAEVLNVARDTVMRDWKFARLWLMRALSS